MRNKGFTLIELLVVIAIIGILSGVVMVSTQSAIEKSKRASALTTASSLLTEFATCQDDGGQASAPVAGNVVCTDGSVAISGHENVKWPNINTGTGWNYSTTGNVADVTNGTYYFTLDKSGQTSIKCKMDGSTCCDDGATGC